MKREDAYYFKILLMCGILDGYYEWLDVYLNKEDPLSDIVLNLSFCGSDINKTISCLHSYCGEKAFDEKLVCDKLRLFLKEGYHTGRFSLKDVISFMHRFASANGDPGDFDMDIWGCMYDMDDYYSLAEDGIISMENFTAAFLSYLNYGIPLNSENLWSHPCKKRKTFLSKLFEMFKKH